MPLPSEPTALELVQQDINRRVACGVHRSVEDARRQHTRDLESAYEEMLDLATFVRAEISKQQNPTLHTIYLDMDDVLVDFTRGALAAHNKRLDEVNTEQWNLSAALGLSEEAFWARCKGHDFWAALTWTPHGPDLLAAVAKMPLPVWLITSPSDDPGSLSGKYAWLMREISAWRRRVVLSTSRLAIAGPGRILIDDREENINAWESAGGTGILVPSPFNRLRVYTAQAVSQVVHSLEELRRRFA